MKRTRVTWSITLIIAALWFGSLWPAASLAYARRQSPSASANADPESPAKKPAAFELARVDKRLVDEFQKAWLMSKNGSSNREAVVLVFRGEDGRYKGRTLPITNERMQLSFKWDPAAIAIVHTHPNHCDPAPGKDDRKIADKLGVPIFTITRSGMFMYDPGTKTTRKVQSGLDWLNSSNFFYGAPQSL